MGMPVVSVASGGMAVVETTSGTPVTEVSNGFGRAVTKVTGGKPGMPVTFESIGVVTPVAPTTWSPTDKSANISLSNGNLTMQAASTADGAVRSVAGKMSGKYYFEVLYSSNLGGGNTGCGIATPAAVLSSVGSAAANACLVFLSGNIYFNGSNISNIPIAAPPFTVCVAVDLDNSRLWYRCNGANWNNSGTANPATNVGGHNISALFPANVAHVIMSANGSTTPTYTANFGGSAFAFTAPSGFTAGWPA